jgi:hypothetical protein
MSIGSGIAFLSVPATVIAVCLLLQDKGDVGVAAIVLGWVGFVMVSRTVRAIEGKKAN